MRDCLFGIETEYSLNAVNARGRAVDREESLCRLLRAAHSKRRRSLPDAHSHGVYLANGGRFYVDCGGHPEVSTPECMNPWDAVRYVLAGDRFLADLAACLVDVDGIAAADVFKCNVDYSGSGQTWGCHESYLHQADPAMLARELIPHLVSRIIYTGAGGFNNRSDGVDFLLSPRVPHLVETVSDDSTHGRGIVHSKDEPLAGGGYRRLHLICGESVCSELAMWLKVGVTALVVRMIEAGLHPGRDIALREPVAAMGAFAADPRCRAVAELAGGDRWTAIRIQRHYLEVAERSLGDAAMPRWAAAVCGEWRAMLDALQGAPESVSTVLDWSIKFALFRERVQRAGIGWESLPAWGRVVGALSSARRRRGPDPSNQSDSPSRTAAPVTGADDLASKGLDALVDLRAELFEIDTRFAQLGRRGIFAALARAGVLTHRVRGVGGIRRAVTTPPRAGRAHARGALIRALAPRARGCACDWQAIYDYEKNRYLDLGDPFITDIEWRPTGRGTEQPAGLP